MLIVYTESDNRVIGWSYKPATITKNSIISDDLKMHGVNFESVAYGYYKDKKIVKQYDEEGNELPLYMDDLDLEPMTAEDLPKSEHIGKLTAVDISKARPATVTRKFYGETYDEQCLVTENVKNLWQAGELNIGDYVLLSYIEEIPETQEREIVIVTDKVHKTW